MFLIPRNHLELFIYSFMVLNIFKIQYYFQICEIFTFWFLFAVNYNDQHMGVDLVCLMQFCLLNIHVRCPDDDMQMGVALSPWSNFINREIQNGRHHAFINNDIYLKSNRARDYILVSNHMFLIPRNHLELCIWCYTAWKFNMVAKYVKYLFCISICS